MLLAYNNCRQPNDVLTARQSWAVSLISLGFLVLNVPFIGTFQEKTMEQIHSFVGLTSLFTIVIAASDKIVSHPGRYIQSSL